MASRVESDMAFTESNLYKAKIHILKTPFDDMMDKRSQLRAVNYSRDIVLCRFLTPFEG